MLFTLAWRNLWRNRRRSLITISSVLFAVLLAIVFFSMEQGSYERMIDSMVKYSTGYMQVQDVLYEEEPSIDNSLLYDEALTEVLESFGDQIAYLVPRIQNFALAATDNQTRGVMVMGVDPDMERRINDLMDNVVDGEFIEKTDSDIMLSRGLAEIMELGVGDTLVLLGQGFQGATAAGRYRIKGIVDLRVPEMNNNTVYMPLAEAQWFYVAEDRLTALIIMPERPKMTNELAAGIQAALDSEWYRVITWETLLKDLLKLMEFDMAGTAVLLMILYIVIAFGLYGTILTMMIERQREFGMLMALGMKRAQLAVVCFLESLMITITGVIAGILVSIPIVFYFHLNPIQLTGDMADAMIDYGFEPIMPFSLDPGVFLTQAWVVLIIAFVVGLYPVYRVFRLNMMEARA